MLEMKSAVQFFVLIGEENLTTREEFTHVFMMLEGMSFDSVITYMICNGIKWETLRAFQLLGRNNFKFLKALLHLDQFNQGYTCAWPECINPTREFLRYCNTKLAIRCLNKLDEFDVKHLSRTLDLQETIY